MIAMNNLPPIEEPQAYGGFLRALWRTWVSACFYPRKFFETVGNSQNLTPALLFGFGCWAILSLFSWFVLFPIALSDREAQKEFGLFLFLSPLLFLVGGGMHFALALLYGLILHLFLLLFGGAKQGLRITLRVVAYAQAPIILLCGIWIFVLYTEGLAAAHRTGIWRSTLAVLVSFILFLCCFGGLQVLLEASQLG
mgnify:CR=1 FL=1